MLFSTRNADKAAVEAEFVERIAMMVLFAEDLQSQLQSSPSSRIEMDLETSNSGEEREGKGKEEEKGVSIDIGLTTAPYYTDKSRAITEAEPPPYPSSPTHIHLLGFDTLTRFLAPKYYPTSSPPLSALAPFFESGYKLLVLLRPDSAVSTDTEEHQRTYISGLKQGSLEKEGFKKEWAGQIGVLEGGDVVKAAGISSTVVREAAKRGDWDEVEGMCTSGVTAWIRDQGLYRKDG